MIKVISIIFATCLISIICIIYFKPEYRSAFEADQQCHFDKSSFVFESSKLGCDHDLETRQWILFNSEASNKPAEILKRYRY